MLKSGDWVQIRYITADVAKGCGGVVKEYPKVRLTTKTESRSTSATAQTRAQNHSHNFTLNVELPNKLIRKIHPILITHINSQPVT